MKKLLVLAAALLLLVPATAMAGMTAFIDMDELSNNELADTTGQAGITLTTTVQVLTGGYIAWGDDNGCAQTLGETWNGWLSLSSIWSDGITLSEVLIDVCWDGTNNWLTIAVPAMTLNQGVRAVRVGPTAALGGPDLTAASLGEIRISGLQLAAITLQIRGH